MTYLGRIAELAAGADDDELGRMVEQHERLFLHHTDNASNHRQILDVLRAEKAERREAGA